MVAARNIFTAIALLGNNFNMVSLGLRASSGSFVIRNAPRLIFREQAWRLIADPVHPHNKCKQARLNADTVSTRPRSGGVCLACNSSQKTSHTGLKKHHTPASTVYFVRIHVFKVPGE
jgi:hypothetical protein